MRRNDREVKAINDIIEIIEMCKTCHVAMIDGDIPYVLPLSFGYEFIDDALILYFHSAKEGRKIDILNRNNKVCYEMCFEGDTVFVKDTPCKSGCFYSSIVGTGKVEFISDVQEKCHGLSLLMERQTNASVEFNQNQANSVCVFKIISKDFIGKRKQ